MYLFEHLLLWFNKRKQYVTQRTKKMFKKLLSNLAFNPSLIGQVSFYAKRLHSESVIRRAGFVMIALTMVLQMFAVISPPEASLQASPNMDLINGGFREKAEAVKHCRDDTNNYKNILNYFGITCNALADSKVDYINPRDHGSSLYSMGRSPVGTPDEVSIQVPGAGKVYTRHFWQKNHENKYKVLVVKKTDGKTAYILFDCGNLVSIGIPTPPDVCKNIPGVQTDEKDCDVCPNKAGIQLTKAECDVCPNKSGVQTTKTGCDVCPDRTGVQTTKDQCDMCPNKSGVQTASVDCDVCPKLSGVQLQSKDCDVCPEISGIQTDTSECKSCEESQTRNDLSACLNNSKKVKNNTQNIGDANGTTAQAGDVLEYSLTTTNKGKIAIKDFIMSDPFGDVLDYADVVNLHGGKLGQHGEISWPKEDLKAGKSITHTITVKIKSPIPATPVSSSDPTHFDMKMTNVFGNTVEINLPKTPEKQVELVTKQLPNTGPGASLIAGFTLTMIVGYFFARSRLLAKELDIVRADFGAAGGY